MAEEVDRTRTLESKAFQEKEQLRSKLEELYEEKERIFQVHLCVGFLHIVRTRVGPRVLWFRATLAHVEMSGQKAGNPGPLTPCALGRHEIMLL